MQPDYQRLLHALQPTITIEVLERNLNAYAAGRPAELRIPEGFEDPQLTISRGELELSARKELLFMSARVRVSLSPEVAHGRLRLKVHEVHAGPIPLPSSFHAGVSGGIETVVNDFLAQNGLELIAVEALPGVLRVTGKALPPAAEPVAGPAQP